MVSKLGTNFPATVGASFGILGAEWAMLGAYTLFLGATTGIIRVDYFMIRHGHGIDIAHLFKCRCSIYWYACGVNWGDFLAWFIALAPLLPGMVNSMGLSVRNESILDMYS